MAKKKVEITEEEKMDTLVSVLEKTKNFRDNFETPEARVNFIQDLEKDIAKLSAAFKDEEGYATARSGEFLSAYNNLKLSEMKSAKPGRLINAITKIRSIVNDELFPKEERDEGFPKITQEEIQKREEEFLKGRRDDALDIVYNQLERWGVDKSEIETSVDNSAGEYILNVNGASLNYESPFVITVGLEECTISSEDGEELAEIPLGTSKNDFAELFASEAGDALGEYGSYDRGGFSVDDDRYF